MPELLPLKGWTPYRALTNLSATEPRGSIADLPAAGFQWVYLIDQEISPGLQQWGMDFDILAADGATVLFSSKLTLPVLVTPGGGPFPAIWSIQNERVATTVPSSTPPTWMNRTEQPLLVPLNDGDLPVQCEVYSANYLVPLPAGAIFKVRFHNIGAPDLRFAPIMTSVLPGVARRKKRMLLDPVTSDQHLPRIVSEMLLVRTALSTGGMTGVESGLGVSYSGGVATVQPGTAVIGFQACSLGAAATVEMSAGQYLFAVPGAGGVLHLVADAGPRESAAVCLGRLKGTTFTPCNGVLVADEVEEVAIARREDGVIVLRYDAGTAQDVEKVSRDRGVTWE